MQGGFGLAPGRLCQKSPDLKDRFHTVPLPFPNERMVKYPAIFQGPHRAAGNGHITNGRRPPDTGHRATDSVEPVYYLRKAHND